MKTVLKALAVSVLIISGFLVANSATGQECPQAYGGAYGGSCPRGQVLIDKLVWMPYKDGGKFVDNLGTQDYKFTATQVVTYKIRVKNTSSVKLGTVEVKDWLPVEMEYVSGPDGATYRSENREVYFEVKDLGPGATRDFEVKTRIVTADKLPQDQSLMCVVNTADARIPENTDRDTAQVCIERPIVSELPDSGPAEWMLVLGGSGAFGIAGLSLMRRAKKIAKI